MTKWRKVSKSLKTRSKTEQTAIKWVKIFTDKDDHVMTAAYQELKYAMEFKRVNEELLEYLSSSIRWLLRYSKNNIPLPEKNKMEEIVTRAMAIADKLPRSDAG